MAGKKVTIRALKRRIENNMVQSESGHYFLPASCLTVIFTSEETENAIDELECPIDEKIGLAQEICNSSMRIFAILIKNGEEDLMPEFRKHEVLDTRLPLDKSLAERIAGNFGIAFAQEYQWQFLPYHFKANMRDYPRDISHDDMILPFLPKPEFVAEGGFGDVSKVSILASQQEFLIGKENSVQVIRKKLRIRKRQDEKSYRNAFIKEQSCLRLLDRLNHPNIISLLGSYSYCGKYYFLFPAHEMDLATFLNLDYRFGAFKSDYAFYSALRGLSSALSNTHRLHLVKNKHGLDFEAIGYHHDLRPANILVSKETFILADFGLGKLRPADAQSQSHWKTGVGDYLAPECMDENFVHQSVGRSIDVWAFGCLITEVAAYMHSATSGLEAFRTLRVSVAKHENWEEGCFYSKDGSLKTSIHEWLADLMRSLLPGAPFISLLKLAHKALRADSKERPTVTQICAEMSLISLRAYCLAVLDVFQTFIESNDRSTASDNTGGMKLWFELERLKAFSQVLNQENSHMLSMTRDELDAIYEKYTKPLSFLLDILESELILADVAANSQDENMITPSPSNHSYNDAYICIEELWNLLPAREKSKVEISWLQTMLDTDDMSRLQSVERGLKVGDDIVYERAAARAMMKRISVEMQSSAAGMPEGFMISKNDIQGQRYIHDHQISILKHKKVVLVEKTSYTPGWERVSPEQRTIVMALKAQCFSEVTRAAQTQTLHCIGVFEYEEENRAGYGFVYEIPGPKLEITLDISVKTLYQLLRHPHSNERQYQPMLGDKLYLAAALANFIGDFHCTGWLHETFHSNNVIFLDDTPIENRDRIIPTQVFKRPYIVGLQKSRLGGRSWDTEGPSSGTDFEDYRHPEYLRTGRFRATYDYYSLGLVLLEIGFWFSLRSWSQQPRALKMSPSEFLKDLLERYVPRLAIEMGATYRDVVYFCLTWQGDSPEDIDVETERIFAQKVIEPLNTLAVTTI